MIIANAVDMLSPSLEKWVCGQLTQSGQDWKQPQPLSKCERWDGGTSRVLCLGHGEEWVCTVGDTMPCTAGHLRNGDLYIETRPSVSLSHRQLLVTWGKNDWQRKSSFRVCTHDPRSVAAHAMRPQSRDIATRANYMTCDELRGRAEVEGRLSRPV